MSQALAWARDVVLTWGAPGLFVVAFLDASFLSLPEINDILLVWMVTRHRHRWVLYSVASTLGSITGCLVLYYLGRKGGDALVRKRFGGPSVERTLASFRRFGVLAVLVPAILPPPAPFKIFVLLAGIAGISSRRFITAIAIGRGFRYFGEGILALKYGDHTIEFVRLHAFAVSMWSLGLLGAGLAAYIVVNRARAARNR